MTRTFPRLALGAAALAAGTSALARPAAAQAKSGPASGPSCDIDLNKPNSLAFAAIGIPSARQFRDTAASEKTLRGIVQKVANDADASKNNRLGVALILVQALAPMGQDLRIASSSTNADLGLPGAATQPVDLLKIVDSLATVVQQAKPTCDTTIEQSRALASSATYNAAVAQFNAQKLDSAARLAERVILVQRQDPLPYYMVASAAQQRNDTATTRRFWPRVVELTAKDTTAQSRNLRSAALENIALNLVVVAQGTPAAEQPTRAKEAADAIRTFLAAYPNSPEAPRFQGTLAQMVQLTGDKAALGSVYADQLSNPDKYDDLALTNAGVIASQAGNRDDAAKLFDAALQKNPYQRDALNNLTATYLQQKHWQQIVPVAQRLVAVDPANPDNYLFLAYAYQGLAQGTTVAAQKTAYTDSLIKYNRLSEQMPVKVSFTEFTRGQTRAVLGVNVEARKLSVSTTTTGPARGAARARPAAAPAATTAPKSYTLAFEFIDKTGAVIDTQNVTVGPLAVGDTKATRVESAKGGVAAFRYKLVG